jgi:hypothetical protein
MEPAWCLHPALEIYSARRVASLTIDSVQFGSGFVLREQFRLQCGRFGAIHFAGSMGIGAHASVSR